MSGKIRLYGNLSFIGVMLQDVGLPRPALQDVDELAVEVSPETIIQAEGDRLFYTGYGRPEDTGAAAVTAGPLWNQIEAVQSARMTRVSDETWFLALGPTGAMPIARRPRGTARPLNGSLVGDRDRSTRTDESRDIQNREMRTAHPAANTECHVVRGATRRLSARAGKGRADRQARSPRAIRVN